MKLLTVIFFLVFGNSLSYGIDHDPKENLTTAGMIKYEGYPVEEYSVTTEDGYILGMQRIPGGKMNKDNEGQRRPSVLILHGMMSTSADWVMAKPSDALAMIMADAGYDVWLGNFRGNTYSRKHVSLNPKNLKFWEFSWDENAKYDLPAMINKVKLETGHDKIHYVAHSMGTTSFMAMMNMKPELGSSIKLASFLAPVAYVTHTKSPIRYLARFGHSINSMLKLLGIGEFLPNNWIMKMFNDMYCHSTSNSNLCSSILFVLCGYDSDQLNKTMLPTIMAHTPGGTSTYTILQYAQEIQTGQFEGFNWGTDALNKHHHGTVKPPIYEIEKVNVPVALYFGNNDWLVEKRDLNQLLNRLPNIYDDYEVPFAKWNHADFCYAIDANTLVYSRVVENHNNIEINQ